MNSQFPSEILERLTRSRVVAVLMLQQPESAVPLAKALLAGGVNAMELTLRTDGAIDALREIRRHVPDMLAGVGTVLTPEQADEVVKADGQFAVSPGVNPSVIRHAQEIGLPFAPGVMTPSDIETAVQLGCRELKFFPAEPIGGLTMLNSVAAPYRHLDVRFLPLGGINPGNMKAWLESSDVFAVGGSWLTPADAVNSGDWAEITQRAARVRQIADSIRKP